MPSIFDPPPIAPGAFLTIEDWRRGRPTGGPRDPQWNQWLAARPMPVMDANGRPTKAPSDFDEAHTMNNLAGTPSGDQGRGTGGYGEIGDPDTAAGKFGQAAAFGIGALVGAPATAVNTIGTIAGYMDGRPVGGIPGAMLDLANLNNPPEDPQVAMDHALAVQAMVNNMGAAPDNSQAANPADPTSGTTPGTNSVGIGAFSDNPGALGVGVGGAPSNDSAANAASEPGAAAGTGVGNDQGGGIFHAGGIVRGKDPRNPREDVPITAQEREMVIPAKVVRQGPAAIARFATGLLGSSKEPPRKGGLLGLAPQRRGLLPG